MKQRVIKNESQLETATRNNAQSGQPVEGIELGKPETASDIKGGTRAPQKNAGKSAAQGRGAKPITEESDTARSGTKAKESDAELLRTEPEGEAKARCGSFAGAESAATIDGRCLDTSMKEPKKGGGENCEKGFASAKKTAENQDCSAAERTSVLEDFSEENLATTVPPVDEEPLVSDESIAAAGTKKPKFSERMQRWSAQKFSPEAVKKFFSMGTLKRWAKRWFIDAFSGMALGLFATLIAGTIFEQIGKLIGAGTPVGSIMISVATIAKTAMGAGIGAGMAYLLKTDKLTMFCCIVAGLVGANYSAPQFFTVGTIAVGIGNPIGAYLTTIITIEVCKLVAGKTPLDIILIPLTALIVTASVAFLLCPPAKWVIDKIALGIEISTAWNPFVMGIIISVVMGILLTMPTSSAAIWATITLANPTSPILLLAGGAAVVGCAAHMVGFAVMSFKENGFGGLIAQGLGTSMLQIPNIMKKPIIMVPPIIASAVVGPLATTVFRLRCGSSGGGMGTAGLVGMLSTIENSKDISVTMLALGIIFCFFVLPAVISWGVCYLFRKLGWIQPGDLKLDL